MRRTRLFLACLGLLATVDAQAQNQEADGTNWQLCANPDYLPLFQPLTDDTTDPASQPADIISDNLDIGTRDQSHFEGNVELRRGTEWLATDALRFDHASQTYRTEGPVKFQNNALRMTAKTAEGNQKTGDIALSGLNYQFHESNGNGSADKVLVQNDGSRLTGANFSTCPSNQQQWQFIADEIKVNDKTHQGVAKNVKLEVGGVPILWLPAMRFPTDSARASGLLSPKIGQDSLNGFDISVPVYLNLAPNYDATLTPRYLSERGWMLGAEFRYLTQDNAGVFDGNYLPGDDIRGGDRYRIGWEHLTAMNRAWYFQSSLNSVSDVYYFSDFGNSITETSTALLKSELGFHGRGKYWNLDLTAANWEIANPTQAPGSEPYRRLPRLALSGSKPIRPWLEAGLNAEAVVFDHDVLNDGRRIDVTPFIKFPLSGGNWFATPSLSWRQTEYWIDPDPFDVTAPTRLTRGLGIFSLDAGAYFERPATFAGLDFIQTLEPRLFYLNVPYRDQNDIPAFDTQPLTFMWPSLFRENRYGGADRQTDANQLTTALTTRFLSSESGKERMNFSLGRITYFSTPKVTLPGEPAQPADGSAWVAEANIRLSDEWQIGVTQHWNPADRNTELSSIRGYWSRPNGLQFNAGYRFRKDFAEQTDFAAVLPINDNWRIMGRWSYSLRDNQNLDSLLGFEWRSCCMAFRVFGRRYIRSFDSRENTGVFLELELNGLGSMGSRPELFKDNGILAY